AHPQHRDRGRMTFGAKLLGLFTGSMLTKLIEIGYDTGLFEASRAGPATSEELAKRAGLKERYVREWLGAMATSGIYHYDGRPREQQPRAALSEVALCGLRHRRGRDRGGAQGSARDEPRER